MTATKRETQRLDAKYQTNVASLDAQAQEKSLGHIAVMATTQGRSTGYKEERKLMIDKNRLIFYADKRVDYGNQYQVLLFDLENRSNADFTIENLSLFGLESSDYEKQIDGVFNCNPRLNADTTIKCSFATLSTAMKDALRLRLDVKTDRGQGSVQW